jgi:hypothetical protein
MNHSACQPASVAAGGGAAPGSTTEADSITGPDRAHGSQRLFHMNQPKWLQSRSIRSEEKEEGTTICFSERAFPVGLRVHPRKECFPGLANPSSLTD